MFGYLRLDKFNKGQNYIYYKKAYCSLCKTLENYYGFLGRMTLSFDLTFLAIIVEPDKYFCCKNTIKCLYGKENFNDNNLKKISAINLMLFYKKLEDNINDQHSLLAKTLLLLYKNLIKKVRNEYPIIWGSISDFYYKFNQSELEKMHISELEQQFADFIISIYKDNFNYDEKYCCLLGNVAKWIYLIDAIDDYEEDIRTKSFNPFLLNRDQIVPFVENLNDFISEYRKIHTNLEFDDSIKDKVLQRIYDISIPWTTANVMKG